MMNKDELLDTLIELSHRIQELSEEIDTVQKKLEGKTHKALDVLADLVEKLEDGQE